MLKGRICKIFLAAGLTLVLAGTIYGQGVREAWVAIYNGPDNLDDAVSDLAVDDNGYVYVTGSCGSKNTQTDFITVKYSPTGETVWARRYNGPADGGDGATALAVDDQGFVYVGGWSYGIETQADYTTIKYSAEGDTVWVRRYNGSGNSYDQITDLDLDDSGNVYVTGFSDKDCVSIKYSPDGDAIWINKYNGPSGDEDIAEALAIDPSSNVYVTGYSLNYGTSIDYLTIKYGPNGDTAWVRCFSRQEGASHEYARAIAVDESGYVCVTGESNSGCTTIRYNPDGDTVWVRRLPAQLGSIAAGHDLKVDKAGYVYVVGEGESDIPYKLSDYVTIKYGPDGDVVWARFYDGPLDEGGDIGQALAVDSVGNVYVTGLSGVPETMFDFVTIKYSPDGDMVWLARYNGLRLDDRPTSLKVDKKGDIYVSGNSGLMPVYSGGYRRPGNRDFVTIKYVQCPPESPTAGNLDGCPPINLLDVILLFNFVYDKDRPETNCLGADSGNCWTPDPVCTGDVDGMSGVNMADMMYLINYVFDRDRQEMDCSGRDLYNCWVPETCESCCKPANDY